MSAREIYAEIIGALDASKANMRCDTLSDYLSRLGFIVRDGRRGGHKLYTHDGILGFASSSYNCGHGKNPEIKPAYIGSVLRVLRKYEVEIIDFLERGTS